jgi:hypothetical protein
MRRVLVSLVVFGLLASSPAQAETYCIYIKSRVTGEEKVHTCREFKSYSECQEAAKRVDGYCGPPK